MYLSEWNWDVNVRRLRKRSVWKCTACNFLKFNLSNNSFGFFFWNYRFDTIDEVACSKILFEDIYIKKLFVRKIIKGEKIR